MKVPLIDVALQNAPLKRRVERLCEGVGVECSSETVGG
jgi:hypothetical protein